MFQRGQSCGGGYSSLGYLFGGDDKPRVFPKSRPLQQSIHEEPVNERQSVGVSGRRNSLHGSSRPLISPEIEKPAAGKVFHDERDTPQGRMGRTNNNYQRVDGQNCGNFITDRPSTRVQASPGGQSSLGYLFG
ncbi:protein SPIRAL1-like 5 [Physcomitrium patens]|uniref:Uncharacterized protein n=2 Tax=Physcomitrium patens TaxID=3218 RepID=A0A2K1JBJ1_PHYPA|nr:protein SPIRAL1-like 3 [Physcomitrium patens]XP_024396839.1 protein SPIRAL1-like 3 [Physcomitrium patens]PNR38899.1 hypothetical protein PHYPA_019177 [Physcomitrium patens]|eukprot:XP_024396838.1 protein SPIRAL1-like 3 [Physcomitrella patens]